MVAAAAGVALASFAAGLLVTAASSRFESAGPVLMVGVPLAAGVTLWALDRPLVAVALWVVSLPAGLIELGPLQVVQVVALGTAGLLTLHRLASGSAPLPWPPTVTWAAVLVVLAFAATPSAPDTALAYRTVVSLAIGLCLALATVAACRGLGDLRRLVHLLMAVGAVMCATSLSSASELRASYGGGVVQNRAVGLFRQPNELGTFSAVLLMVSLGVVLGARSRRERLGAAATVLISLAALGLTLSRGAWIGTVLAGLVLIAVLPQARRGLLLAGVPIVLAAAAFGVFRPSSPQVDVVSARLGTIVDPAANPYDDRPAIYREAFRQIRLDPLTGQGPGNFPRVAVRSASASQNVRPYHAHNVLLTVAAELGLPAAALVVGLAASVALRMARARRVLSGPDAALVLGIGAGMFAFVGQGLVDFTMRNPTIFLFVWFGYGLVLVCVREIDSAVAAVSRGRLPAGPRVSAGA
jgi:O-antigen ligase